MRLVEPQAGAVRALDDLFEALTVALDLRLGAVGRGARVADAVGLGRRRAGEAGGAGAQQRERGETGSAHAHHQSPATVWPGRVSCSLRSSSIGMWQRMWWPGSTSARGGSSFSQIVAQEARAARVEDAARGRVGGARDVALEPDALALLAVDRRHGREQRLGVRVVRPAEHGFRGAELHQPAEVEHRDAVGEVADDAEVVRDEEVGGLALGLQLDQQVEDRRLHGDVERRGGLVADDEPRLARERARDRDALLQPARELRRRAAGSRGRARRTDSLSVADALVGRLAGDAGQALERAAAGCAAPCAARLSAESGFWKTIWSARTSSSVRFAERRRERAARPARRCRSWARRCRAACARTSSCRSRTRRRGRASRRARSRSRRRRARARSCRAG